MTGEQDFWGQYADEVIGAAEKAAQVALTRSSFGKLTFTNRYFYFSGSPETGWGVEECNFDEYRRRMADSRLARNTRVEVVFEVDVQEMNPALQFTYSRKVQVGDKDWVKTLVPSIEAIFGQGSMGNEKRGPTMQALYGSYVKVNDVPQQPKKNDKHLNKETGDPYLTIQLAQVFEDQKACREAYVAVFGEPDTSLPAFPKDYGDLETWEALKESAVTPKVKELLDGGMNEAAVVKMVAKEFGVQDGFIQAICDEVVPV